MNRVNHVLNGGVRCFRRYSRGQGNCSSTQTVSGGIAMRCWSKRWFSAYPEHILLPMPALSPTMTEGAISSWQLKEGDEIGPGVVICEIETDKATVDYEAQEEGFLAKILLQEGAKNVQVGQPIGVVVEEKAFVDKFHDFVPPQEPVETPSTPATPAVEQPPVSTPVVQAEAPRAPSPSKASIQEIGITQPAAPSPTVTTASKPPAKSLPAIDLNEFKSPLLNLLRKQQMEYHAKYGPTQMTPLDDPAEKDSK